MNELINNVNELIRLGKGDLGRLTHIKDTLQQNKTLYESDKEYLEKLSKQYLSDNHNVDETHYDQPNSNLFCHKCGQKLKSGSSFCLKCGFSIFSSTSKKENHNVNSKNEKIEREESIVAAIAVSIVGFMIIIFGIGIIVYSFTLPILFAGQYTIVGLIILVIGGLIMYGGKRLIKKKISHFLCGYCNFIAETEHELYNHSLLCEKKKSEDSLLQEKQQLKLSCEKCGSQLLDDSSFCKNCGTKIQNKIENEFCGKCGNKVYGNNPCINCNQSTNSQMKSKKKGLSKKKKIGIAFGIIILLFFGLAILSSNNSGINEAELNQEMSPAQIKDVADADIYQDDKVQHTDKILNLPYTWTSNNFIYTLDFKRDYSRHNQYIYYELVATCQNLLKSSNEGDFQPVLDAKLKTTHENMWDLLYAKNLNACQGKFDPQQIKQYPSQVKPYFKLTNPDEKPDVLLVSGYDKDLIFNVKSESISCIPVESRELKIASFVDLNTDPQYYIDRYNNEPSYKKWFDENFPEYFSIYDAVGCLP